ncbi:MAG: methyltransferase family protein [Candidatus Promineifilaceae bacterium]
MNEQSSPPAAGAAVPPPFVFLGFLLAGIGLELIFPLEVIPAVLGQVLGGLLFLAGLALGINAIRLMMRAGTSPDPHDPSAALVSEGPFRFTRNPIYLSMALLYAGIAVFFDAIWALLLLPLALVVIDRYQIRREERYLEQRFGEEYASYKRRVRRWI